MKKIQRLISQPSLLLLLLSPLLCFTQPQQAWLRTYNASGAFSTDRATALTVSRNNNIYVTGTTGREGKGLDFTTIKYGNHGDIVWTKKYTGPDNGDDYATAIWVDADENVYVTGYSAAGNNLADYDYATVKYDKDGNTKWVRRWAGSYGDDRPSCIAVDAVGNVYVSGSTNGVFNNYDYATVKYSKDGKEEWVRTYDGPFVDRDFANAIAVDAASNVYVAGTSLGIDGNEDYAVIKYNTNGEELWVERYNGPANLNDAAYSIAVDASSNVYVTGSSVSQFADDFTTIKYNTDGEQLWLQRYNPSDDREDFRAKIVKLDAAGNVLVAGESGNLTTVKYSSDGKLKWAADYRGDNGGEDSLRSLAVDANGNVYITGGFGSDPYMDIATIKYNAAGKEKWVKTLTGTFIPEWDRSINVGVSVGVDANGNVFMTGTVEDAIHARDIITVKYNAKGEQKWLKQVNGESNGNDEAKAMAVDLQGNMYITGTTDANDPHQDIVTIKYDNTGNKLWGRRVGFKNGSESPTAIAVDSAGNVYITGEIWQNNKAAFLTFKYDTDGNLQWSNQYNAHGNIYNQVTTLAVDQMGNVIVLGFTTADNRGAFAIVKYNTEGVQEWEALYNGPGFNTNFPTAMVLDAAGNVYVTGMTDNTIYNTDYDFATVKYDAAGKQQWASTYNGPFDGFDKPTSITVDAAGNVYVVGTTADIGYSTIKYDASGNELWVARSAESPPQTYPKGLAVDGAGNVYVTSHIFPLPNEYPFGPQIGTIKYNSAGVQQWINLYNGKTSDPDDKLIVNANGITLDKAGNIYVYGTESITNDFDLEIGKIYSNRNFVTIKYNSSGNTQWTEKLKIASATSESFLAIDNDNNLYVAGTRLGRGTNNDFLAVKYTQPAETNNNAESIITKSGDGKKVNKITNNTDSQDFNAVAFPNPFHQNFTLQWKGKQPVNIMIIDAAGRLIDRKTNLAATGSMQAGSNYSTGMYYVQIMQGNEQVTLKLMKE